MATSSNSNFLPLPDKADAGMSQAGAAVLRSYLPNMPARNAALMAAEAYREMVKARPKIKGNEEALANLTPTQAFYFHVIHDLAEDLGRFPLTREIAGALGHRRPDWALRALQRLATHGYVVINRSGKGRGGGMRIAWLRPRK